MAKEYRGGKRGINSNGKPKQTEHIDKWSQPPSFGEQVSDSIGVSVNEGDEIAKAVYSWSGADYKFIREAVYTGDTNNPDYQKGMKIEKFIDKSPKWDGELYRGASLSLDVLSQLQVGGIIDMRGMSSWSSDDKVAKKFTKSKNTPKGNEKVIFHTTGTKKGASITQMSRFGKKESEVIVSNDARWTIKSMRSTGRGTTYIELVEVD